MADINGDGKLDVAYEVGPGVAMAMFLGNGDGTFQTEFQVAAGSYPDFQSIGAIVAADFNNDGQIDLALPLFQSPVGGHLLMLLQGEFPALSYPVDVEYFAQPIGITSSKTVSLLDTGLKNVTISGMVLGGPNSSAYIVTQDTCTGATLIPSAACTFVANYTPDNPGGHAATLVVTDDAIGNPQTILLTGETVSGAGMVLSSTDVTFPSEPVGTASPTQTVTVTSGGDSPLEILQINLNGLHAGDFSQTNNCTSALPPGSTCQIVFTFTPSGSGTRVASVIIGYNNGPVNTRTIYLTGNRLSGPQLVFDPTAVNFPVPVNNNSSAVETITLVSAGSATVAISVISLTGPDAIHFFQSNTCGATLQVNATCQISLSWQPVLFQSSSATLQISNNTSESPHLILITGPLAPNPEFSLSPQNLTFSAQVVGTVSSPQIVTISSIGQLPLVYQGTLNTGPNPDEFELNLGTCFASGSLPPGSTCQVTVQFAPQGAGTRTATWVMSTNAPSNVPPAPSTLVSFTGTGVAAGTPSAAVVPLSVNYSAQPLGTPSVAQTITITNTGTNSPPLTVSDPSFAGADPLDFSVLTSTCLNGTIADGQSCQIAVVFDPAAIGSRSATMALSTVPLTTSFIVSLAGTGAPAPLPVATVAPSSLTFPSQFVGASGLLQTVVLTNTGSVAISIAGIVASPADFGTLSSCGTTLAAGGTCSIGVFFDPTVSGARSGTLTITDSAGNSPQTVTLSGTGEDFSVAPAAAPTATVKAGQAATYMLNLAPGGGFSKAVTFSCSGAPAFSTCVVSPNPAMVTGSTVTATVTVTTTAASHIVPNHPNQWPEGTGKYPGMLLAVVLAALLLLLNEQRHKRRVKFSQASALFLCFALITVAACGGGSSGGGNSPPGGSSTGTTAGSYTLTVTAAYSTGSTTLSHQTNLTLVVQ